MRRIGASLRPGDVTALISGETTVLAPALTVVAIAILWAAHDGGYDADTWYWGALGMLALVTAAVTVGGWRRIRPSGSLLVATAALAAYVGWSYLSILWADAPGQALEGGNRALLYLLVFTLFATLPFGERTALITLTAFTLGVGALVVTELLRLATGHLIAFSLEDGRLVAPTAYFNATAALFTTAALVATAISARRTLPVVLRGVLAAVACGALQLAVLGQSRGWLFTLPLIALAAVFVVRDRLRLALVAAPMLAGVLASVPRLLDVFRAAPGPGAPIAPLALAARRAAHTGLLACAAVLLVVTAIAIVERHLSWVPSRRVRRFAGAALAAAAIAGAGIGGIAATHGDPFGFVSRQWHRFTHVPVAARIGGSHFVAVGSGRYDFWRVAWRAALAHPVGGLGQDNFGDYYVSRRRTYEEPRWTHSLELRLLAHTGFVGLALFAAFVLAAVRAAVPAVRRGAPAAAVSAAALLPMVDWLIHGSVDWFWEFPALTGPAFAFLALAGRLGTAAVGPGTEAPTPASATAPDLEWRRRARCALAPAGVVAVVAATVALAFPYLSVREVSHATDEAGRNPAQSLRDLATAADLNPLSSDPGRVGGTIALVTLGRYTDAAARFRQATSREPHGWFSWLGAGLTASMLGDRASARRDLSIAQAINSRLPTIAEALGRVDTADPMTPSQAIHQLMSVR